MVTKSESIVNYPGGGRRRREKGGMEQLWIIFGVSKTLKVKFDGFYRTIWSGVASPEKRRRRRRRRRGAPAVQLERRIGRK